MRLLSITLMLVATSILVHSAAASEDFGHHVRTFVKFLQNTCHSESEIKECYHDTFQGIRDFGNFSRWIIEPCTCNDCAKKNLERAAFDISIFELFTDYCKDVEGEKLAKCMADSFDEKVDDFQFEVIDPKEEYDILTQMGKSCWNEGKRGEDMEKCAKNKYMAERAQKAQGDCSKTEDRDLKLYNSLRALLKRYQK